MNFQIRNTLAAVHRWTGLSVGLIVIMLGVTGAVLSMRPQLDRLVYGNLLVSPPCSSPISLDAVIEAALKVHKGPIVNLRVQPSSSASTIVRFKNDDFLFVDPCTGALKGIQNRWGGLFGAAEQLHKLAYKGFLTTYEVLSDPLNEFITGAISVVFAVVLVAGGLFLWWPRRWSVWRAAARINPRLRGRSLSMNVHTTLGFYASAIVVVSALTGASMVFEWPKSVLFALTGSSRIAHEEHSVVPPDGTKRLPIEGIWKAALNIMPPPEEAAIFLGRKPTDPVTIYSIDVGASHPQARNYLRFDAYTGKLLEYTPYSKMGRAMQLYYWGQSIHTGRVGGLLLDLVLLFGGLSAAFVGYTGLESYVRKKTRGASITPSPKTIAVRISKIERATSSIKIFDLVPTDGGILPAFEAGSHIDVMLPNGFSRQYSLCNGPDEVSAYRIGVKRDLNSRGGSRTLHDELREGDLLTISEPRCNFPLDTGASHSLLIAAGIGITPILSMAKHLEAAGRPWSMRYYGRAPEDAAFHAFLQEEPFKNKVIFCRTGDRVRLREEIAELVSRREAGHQIYMCGPSAFMEMVVAATQSAGWPQDDVHLERFKASIANDVSQQSSFELHLARSKKTLTVPAGRSIAEALRLNKITVPTSCEQGVCGTCMMTVLGGTPEHRDVFLSATERQAGDKILICVSRALTGRLVLDA